MLNLYICYVIVFKKKKELGDLIKRINWQLFNNDELIINNENVECEYKDKIIKYKEEDGINIIDLENQIYKRDSKEYLMQINIKNNTFKFTLKEKNRILSDNLTNSSIEKKDNDIIIKYQIEDEVKKIIIHLL